MHDTEGKSGGEGKAEVVEGLRGSVPSFAQSGQQDLPLISQAGGEFQETRVQTVL